MDAQLLVRKVLLDSRRIAVVGLSSDPYRPSNQVARTLIAQGFEVIPVNPAEDRILGLRSYSKLDAVPGEIDIVDIFRRPEFIPQIARDAAAKGAKCLWLQSGLSSQEAAAIAKAAKMDYIENRCLAVEVQILGAKPVGIAERMIS